VVYNKIKLIGIKDKENELYFQLERVIGGLKFIDKLSNLLFGEEGYIFENRWQIGLPENEDCESFEKDGKFMAVVVSKERTHIILKGIENAQQVKNFVNEKLGVITRFESLLW